MNATLLELISLRTLWAEQTRTVVGAHWPQGEQRNLAGEVLVGKQVQLPARLILIRASKEVIAQQQERLRKDAKRKGRPVNAHLLQRAAWTTLITNVPASMLSIAQVVVLQRGRWQIEVLFKLWKEGGQVDAWRGRTSSRVLCEIYAKIMALLLQHWLLVVGMWHDPYRSLFKAANVIRRTAPELLSALRAECSWSQVTRRLVSTMQTCRLHRRLKHPSHPQLLLEGLDWGLTSYLWAATPLPLLFVSRPFPQYSPGTGLHGLLLALAHLFSYTSQWVSSLKCLLKQSYTLLLVSPRKCLL